MLMLGTKLASLLRTAAAATECQALQSHVAAHLRAFSSWPVHHALHHAWKQNTSQSISTDEADSNHDALRNISLAQLPPGFKLALQRYIASSGASAKEMRVMASHLRSKTAELEQHLLANAAPATYNEQGPFASAPRTASGRVTRQALYEASIALEHEGSQPTDPEVFNKLLGLPSPSSTTNRGKVKHGVHRSMRATRPKPPLEYNEQQALAAAAASSSAWYATTLRVLHELRSADPDFRPTNMLDFGAGFGGATQAAQQVWPSRLRNVTAVERSPTMLHFSTTHMRQAAAATATNPADTPAAAAAAAGAKGEGRNPTHARFGSSPFPLHSAQAGMAGPRVTWTRGLPKLPGKDGAAVVPPRFQLVVGAYVLSEENLLLERLRLIDQLWGHTADTLVLIEQGSRLGSSLILEARNRILDREARKASRLQNHQHHPHFDTHQDHPRNDFHDPHDLRNDYYHDHHHGHRDHEQQGPGSRAVSLAVEREEEKGTQGVGAGGAAALPVGAHVVAPCPHDGRCPLEGNPKVWCHFGQRYETPDFMRNTLGRGKDGIAVRGAMDAHYSYVILRRGPRPKAAESSRPLPNRRHVQSMAQDQPITEEELWHEILSERMHTQEKPLSGLPKVRQGLELENNQALAHDRGGIPDSSSRAAVSLSTRVDAMGQHLAKVEGGEDGPWAEGNPAAATEAAEGVAATAAAAASAAPVERAPVQPRRPLFADVDTDSVTGADAALESSEEQQQQSQAGQHPHQNFEGGEHVFRDSSHGNERGDNADMRSSSSGSSSSEGGSSSSDFDLGSRNGDSSFDWVPSHEHPHGSLDPGAPAEVFERKYPAHGRGLVDRLMALEDAGIRWASNREDGLDVGAVEAAIAHMSQEELPAGSTGTHQTSDGDETVGAAMFGSEVDGHASLNSHAGKEAGADATEQHKVRASAGSAALHDALPDEVERAMHRLILQKDGAKSLHSARTADGMQGSDYCATAAAPWPRIYREPMKRGGHVILDLCMPLEDHSVTLGEGSGEGSKQAGADARAGAPGVGGIAGAPRGRLSRQVVTKANAGRLLEREAYRLSKEVSWGDLWPSYYTLPSLP